MITADIELRYGYTLGDLDRIARGAAKRTRAAVGTVAERHDIARYGAVEALYASDGPIAEPLLFRAAVAALWAESKNSRHLEGRRWIDDHTGTGFGAIGSMPNFVRYWGDANRATPSPEARVVDRMTLAQILPTLTPGQRAALVALAVHDDYALAAEALGLAYSTFVSRVSVARERFLALWHEGEQPSKPWGRDRRGVNGRPPQRSFHSVMHKRGRQAVSA